MTWHVLPTYTTGSLTAAMLQAIADNINETAPAKATAAGRIFVSTGTNSIAQREIKQAQSTTQSSTTSNSYIDISGDVGPTVVITTGTLALVSIQAQMFNSGATSSCWSSYAMSGATSDSPSDQRAISCEMADANQGFRFGASFLHTVNAGSNTFKQQYRVGSGTGFFDDRNNIVMAL